MSKYLSTLRYMLKQGMSRDKAIAAVKTAFALTAEQTRHLEEQLDK